MGTKKIMLMLGIVLLVLVSFVSAIEYKQDADLGLNLENTATTINRGHRIYINETCYLVSATKYATDQSTHIQLVEDDGTNLSSPAISGNVATFNYIKLTQGNYYRILASHAGTADTYYDAPSYTYVNYYISFVSACQSDDWGCQDPEGSNRPYSILYLNVTLGAVPQIIANATNPDPSLPTQDWLINITATDSNNASFFAWTQFYVNNSASGGQLSHSIANNTNTNIANLSSASIDVGSNLTAEVWVGDGELNSSKYNITTTVDITSPNASGFTPEDEGLVNVQRNTVLVNITDTGTGVDNDTITLKYSICREPLFNCGGFNTMDINNNFNTSIITNGYQASADTPDAAMDDGDYWNISIDASDNAGNPMTTTYWSFIFDETAPTITTDGIDLNKTYVYSDHNLTAQINFSDAYLYSINISINNSILFNTTGLDQSLYVYNLSQNMSSYSAGVYNITARACDGHTTLSLKDEWEYDIGLSGLTYKDKQKWYRINPTNNDLFESISTTKLTDRYTFEYSKSSVGKLLSGSDTYTFVVESSEYIDIINRPDSKYNAWLVIPTIGLTGRWIDFNLKDVEDAKYVVKRLNDKQVEITITNVPKDIKELVFESTGELNCITEHYYFYVYNYALTHDLAVLETSSQTFTFNITRDTDYITNANATLNWNGTLYIGTKTTTDDYFLFSKTLTMPSITGNSTNITFNWTYSLVGNINKTNITSDYSQQIYDINMDDCSTYSIVALNFSLIEESNNASIAGDMDFTFSLAQEGTTINYSKSVTGVNSTAFCIPHNDVSFTAQLQSEYTAAGYDAHTYFAYNLAIDNTTNYIYYYLTNGTTIVEFTVLDQNGDTVEDAYIKVKKYDIGTGTYKTIETLKTDEQGKALGNIILDIAWYEFVVEYGGTVYLNDGPTKITSTTRTFRINLLSDFYERYTDVIYGITSSLNYTDATGNFRFTWSDPDGNYHYGCLKVTKESLAGNTLINETCVASTAGTILVNINSSGSVNGTYVAVGYIKFDEPYVLQILRKTWGSLSETFGSEGLFYGFLIIFTLAMVGIFAPKVAMILAVIGLVFSSILGFFNMNPSWIIALVIAAGLTIYRMRDN